MQMFIEEFVIQTPNPTKNQGRIYRQLGLDVTYDTNTIKVYSSPTAKILSIKNGIHIHSSFICKMNFEEKLENTVKMKDNFNNNLIVTFIGHKIHKSIGIITSGGDAPGMNSAIRSIVRTSIRFNQNVFGVYRGYDGLINDYICQLGWDTETHNMSEGGTVLLSFRSQKFYEREGRKQAVLNLVKRHINSLIILGGDGSLKGGILLRNEFRELQEELINENKLCIDDYVYSNINEQINEIDNFYGKPECYKETPKINLNRFTGGNNDSIVTSIVTSVESANNSVDNENKEECINENEHNVQIIDNLNNECKSSNMNNENFSTNKDNENTTINKNRDKLNNGIENLQNIKNKEEFITKREEEIKTKDKNLNSENTNVFNITNKSSLNKINSTTTDNSSKNIKNKSKISNESSRNEGKTNSTTQDCLKYNTNLTQEKTLEKNNLNIKDYIYDLKIVGIPASIDNDIYGADFTLGADTAMNRIVESIDHLSSTMRSHQRIFVVEVMGNTCGWLSIMTSISCISDYMLIPEDPPEDWKKEVLENIRFAQKHGKPGMFIIISEGSIDKQNIKIQSSEVVDFIKSYNIDVRLLKLGHVQRGGPTSAFDRILGTLSGIKAFEELFTDLVPRVVLFKDGDLNLYELEHIIEMNDSLKKYQQEKQYNKIIQLRGNLFKTLHRIYNTIISNKKDNRALFMEDINLKLLVQDNIHLKNKYDKLNQKIPSASVRIGIIQCGKRASGMNNSLNSIIQYCYSMKVDPYIILNGFDGLIKDQVIKAQLFEFSNDFNNGGANLGLGSVDILDLKLVLDKLEEHRINNLIIIGDSDCLPLLEELKIENSRRVNCSFIKDENISLSENKKTILCGNKERNFNENKSLSKISDDIKNDNKDHIDKDNDNMNDNNLNNINLKGIDLNKIKTNDINDITIDNYYLKTDSSETYSNIEKNKEFANNVKHCSKENSFDNKKINDVLKNSSNENNHTTDKTTKKSFIEKKYTINKTPLNIILVPSASSNNIPCTEISIGSDTALNTILKVADCAKLNSLSNKKHVFVLEIGGENCGFLTLMAGIAAGSFDCFIPERKYLISHLSETAHRLRKRLKSNLRSGIVVFRNEKTFCSISTESFCRVLKTDGKNLFDTDYSVICRLQQGISPTPIDRINAFMFGVKAVDFCLNNKGIGIVGLEGSNVVFTEIDKVMDLYDVEKKVTKNPKWIKYSSVCKSLE